MHHLIHHQPLKVIEHHSPKQQRKTGNIDEGKRGNIDEGKRPT